MHFGKKNLKENVETIAKNWLKPKPKKYGDSEENLRERYKNNPDIVDLILKQRKELTSEKDEVIKLELYEENMEIFLFIFNFLLTPSVFIFSFNGPVGFNWQNVKFFAESSGLNINNHHLHNLMMVEQIFLKQIQEN